MKLIFLDIDGVLNGHEQLASGYCGICRDRTAQLNRILSAVPEAKIVISSAWRYLILRQDMTLKGFEYLLLVHGVQCHERVHGITDADGKIEDEPNHFDSNAWKVAGLKWRAEQIGKYVAAHSVPFVVLDDLKLSVSNLVLTDGKLGLTAERADEAIEILRGQNGKPE